MNKKFLYAGVGIAVALALSLPVSNLLAAGPTGTALTSTTTDDASLAPVASVLEHKCAFCHVSGSPRPFYAGLPIASGMIEGDIKAGLRDIDLVEGIHPGPGLAPNEAALAKIEREIHRGSMPPRQFKLLHWNGGLSADEQKLVRDWIRSVRTQTLATPGFDADVAARVIRPLPSEVKVDAKKAELGRKLYHDKRLSGDDTISCATCHDLAKGGTDQEPVSTGIKGQKGGINAPTTFNAGFQFMQFWDGRASSLEDQADGPPNNPIEMGTNWEQVIGKLSADEAFTADFEAAYPEGYSKATLTHAIAEFERTLVTPGRFDKYLRGDASALTADEIRGYEIFLDHGCATCHVGELLGGQSFELMGRRADYFKERGGALTDADQGRWAASKREQDRQKFKVPTLRNVALTFPYFHDASAKDLDTAVRVMAQFELGEPWPDADRQAVVTFLQSLTGEYQGKSL